jgi:hypothetical protein
LVQALDPQDKLAMAICREAIEKLEASQEIRNLSPRGRILTETSEV